MSECIFIREWKCVLFSLWCYCLCISCAFCLFLFSLHAKKGWFVDRCEKLYFGKQTFSQSDAEDACCHLLVWGNNSLISWTNISLIEPHWRLLCHCGSRDFSLLTPLSSPHSATLEISLFCLRTAPSAIIGDVEQPERIAVGLMCRRDLEGSSSGMKNTEHRGIERVKGR